MFKGWTSKAFRRVYVELGRFGREVGYPAAFVGLAIHTWQ